MKKVLMKGKTVDEAVKMALEVLGGEKENVAVRVINEGKAGMLGMIGGEEAEVEVVLKNNLADDAKSVLQDILDRMQIMALAEIESQEDGVGLVIKGEDMGRIIGKDGATIVAFETLLRGIIGKAYGEKVRINIDAGEYKKKRNSALERLAIDAAEGVIKDHKETILPPMSAADRRIIHICLKDKDGITTYSKGEGRDRRLVIAPKQ